MKKLSPIILGLSTAESVDFLDWLSECCGMTLSDLSERPVWRQNEAYLEYLRVTSPTSELT